LAAIDDLRAALSSPSLIAASRHSQIPPIASEASSFFPISRKHGSCLVPVARRRIPLVFGDYFRRKARISSENSIPLGMI
jgi:hypothetical protein